MKKQILARLRNSIKGVLFHVVAADEEKVCIKHPNGKLYLVERSSVFIAVKYN